MNATLRSIQLLLKHPEKEMQLAAIRVLGAINPKDPLIHRSLGEIMLSTNDQEILNTIFLAISKNPNEQLLRYLIKLLEKDDRYQEEVLNIIAKIGPKAINALKQTFERVDSNIKQKITRVLPCIKTHHAHAFLIEVFMIGDAQIIRSGLKSLREQIFNYSLAEKNDLYTLLYGVIKDKKNKQDELIVSAIIIALGILSDLRSKNKLMNFLKATNSSTIRKNALISLAALDFGNEDSLDLFNALVPLVDEQDYEGVVKYALLAIDKLPVKEKMQEKFRNMLSSNYTEVKRLAINKLTSFNNPINATLILNLLENNNEDVRKDVFLGLEKIDAVVGVILKYLDEGHKNADYFKILARHSGKLTNVKAKERLENMLYLLEKEDNSYKIPWQILKILRPDVLKTEIFKRTKDKFIDNNYSDALKMLKLIESEDLEDFDLLYNLSIAYLKILPKSLDKINKIENNGFKHLSKLISTDYKMLKYRLTHDKIFDDEELFYIGSHFIEKFNEERRFGADLLRFIVTNWSRRNTAKVAKKKLSVEGL